MPPAQIPSMRNYRTGLLPQVKRKNIDSGNGATPRGGNTLLHCFSYSVQTDQTLVPASVCWSRSPEHSSLWPKDFSPRTPPVVDQISLVGHPCSFVSSILFLRPTSQVRTCRAYGLSLPRPGQLYSSAGHPWDLPVSVQRACVHAPVL